MNLSRKDKVLKYQLLKERARRRAKSNLLDFTLWNKDDYVVNWHHKSYASVLDRFISGEIKRLMVFMPPQHGKSELCSRQMPAKILGDYPDKRLAIVAYNETFATKFNRSVQRIIDTEEYRQIYPETRLSTKNIKTTAKGNWLRNSLEFEIVGKKGSLISAGIGGSLTGNRVDVAIIDDPYKDQMQANSAAYRKMVEEWWDAVLDTRLNNAAQICLTFTRWRHDDIAGKLLEIQKAGLTSEKWHIVLYEGLKETENDDPFDTRKIGDALWPVQRSRQRLLDVKAKNPMVFEAMYQQRPTPKSGNVIKRDYFGTYDPFELPEGINHIYVDTATSEKELKNNDPSGKLVFRKYQNKLYLVYFEKGRLSSPELRRKIIQIHERYCQGTRSKVVIENKANGRSTKQDLEIESNLNIILENIKGSKLERVENQLSILEARRVLLPKNEPWVESFLAVVMGFPYVKHDEEVDCLTGAIRMTIGNKGKKFNGRSAVI